MLPSSSKTPLEQKKKIKEKWGNWGKGEREKNKINMAKESMKTGNNIPLFMLS